MHDPFISASDVDDFFVLRTRSFAAKFQRAMMRDVLGERDIPLIEWQLLFSIARFGTCHLAHVTQNTSMDPAHGSRAASSLEAKGLIVRQDDPSNRRRKLISLTPAGVALFQEIWPEAKQMCDKVASALSAADLKELKRLLVLLDEAGEQLDQNSKRDNTVKKEVRPLVAATIGG